MAAERWARILALLVADGHSGSGTSRLWQVCASVTHASGAVVMLGGRQAPLGSWCTADEVSRLLEEAQYTLGEGPRVDAYNLELPVIEPDLTARKPLGGRCSRRPP